MKIKCQICKQGIEAPGLLEKTQCGSCRSSCRVKSVYLMILVVEFILGSTLVVFSIQTYQSRFQNIEANPFFALVLVAGLIVMNLGCLAYLLMGYRNQNIYSFKKAL